jgi:hypothetical protein
MEMPSRCIGHATKETQHVTIPTKREKKFRKTFEKMEGFSFVKPVTGLNRPNTGKEDDDEVSMFLLHSQQKI